MKVEVTDLFPCTIGNADNSACHLTSYNWRKGLKLITEYTPENQLLISWRCGLSFANTSQICLHHEALFLTQFESLQRNCCNPFHKKHHVKQKDLRPIALVTADQIKDLLKIDVKPGQKLCSGCRKEFTEKSAVSVEASTSSLSNDPDDIMQVSESVKTSLTAVGISSVKFEQVGATDVKSYAKQKISEAQEVIAEKIAALNNIDCHKLIESSTSQQCTKCLVYDQLMEDLKQNCVCPNAQNKSRF